MTLRAFNRRRKLESGGVRWRKERALDSSDV